MRVSKAELERNHGRIVEAAARLMRERGIEATSIADVMGEAGLTHGGFYRHFDAKQMLVEAALQAAFGQMMSRLEAAPDTSADESAGEDFRAGYLSDTHVGSPGEGCPVAALGGEIARQPDAIKATFGKGVEGMIAALAERTSGTREERRDQAVRELAMLVGAVTMARASDPHTASAVLSACRARRRPSSATSFILLTDRPIPIHSSRSQE